MARWRGRHVGVIAIGNYGLGAGFGRSRFDRLIGRIRRLPHPLALSLRNTSRQVALRATQVSVRESLAYE